MGWLNRGSGRAQPPALGGAPAARAADLVVEELGDELLVYDHTNFRAHCLSPTAARVWRTCDGRTSSEALGAKLGLDVGLVEDALDELRSCELLESAPEQAVDGSTRRELTLRAVKVGAAAASVPLIFSVVAPPPSQAATIVFCTALGGGVGNCGQACCNQGTGCCCCNGNQGNKRCVDSATHCTQLLAGGNVTCGASQCGP